MIAQFQLYNFKMETTMEPKEKLQTIGSEPKKQWQTPDVSEVGAKDATQNGAPAASTAFDGIEGYS